MNAAQLRDMARSEREFAAGCIADENYMRAMGFDGGQFGPDEAPAALSRAAELERAASLDEVSP